MRKIDADALKEHIDKLPALPDGNFAGNHSALKALINMQPTIEPEQRWIPCEERLPEDGQEILFSTKTGRAHSGTYHDDDSANRWYSHRDRARAWNNVVNAWMPLPEPYKGDES